MPSHTAALAQEPPEEFPAWAVVLIVLAGLLVLLIIIIIVAFLLYNRRGPKAVGEDEKGIMKGNSVQIFRFNL